MIICQIGSWIDDGFGYEKEEDGTYREDVDGNYVSKGEDGTLLFLEVS